MISDVAGDHRQGGMTLVEVLVALVVLSIGLLGIAALQTTGLRATQTAGARTHATMLAYDIIDRMRANRSEALLGVYLTTTADDYIDTATIPAGTAGVDLAAWKARLREILPEGRGAITVDAGDPSIVTVTVEWLDRDENRASDAQVLQFQTTTRL